jgi:hypothetical protein
MSPEYVPALIAGTVAIAVALLSPAFTAAADRRLRKRDVLAEAVGPPPETDGGRLRPPRNMRMLRCRPRQDGRGLGASSDALGRSST